ncbi:MAG TPA: tRNA preQ1(34) S-adenosylmethionine ribosyltransferase-isomerase QueA [Candidatus Binatia bacterium]|nr:tRNA preQ1(34) S-adenosylmethionine ribosyltransferase-isomerase QueA [Candidatus Binatia bacterium]
MRLADLDYALPPELIAQEPAAERTAARLLVLARDATPPRHARVGDLPRLLRPGDLLVLNDARVIPARVRARRPSGGRLEILLVRPLGSDGEWEALVRGSPRPGERVHLADAEGQWVAPLGRGRWRLELRVEGSVLAWLERVGEVPLPPYIRRPGGPTAADAERYQTVFARVPGAVAAPTAGLHFTTALLEALARDGVGHVALSLDVGPGTFLPLRPEEEGEGAVLPERYDVPAATAERIAAVRAGGGRVVAVGTTVVRALESAAGENGLRAGPGEATLFVRPGHRFRVVDGLLTNFHLPRTPLLALVAAFAGWERVRDAYAEAVRHRYRFYSYGDAMLIL